ncbi:oocyte zinc finger protein XlCOF6-like [Pectinophora gossypiella]|uniref:Protein krueppel n=1 Tax=Pectinophora gossypiella TaxID=13191 RepID=A0A1E1WMT5_PECGO|nr:oocyte zinc finger protein XlCOF6-like [Pectinophora gossypiella]
MEMATNIKDLCRLCAKKHEISKDLLDESNKHVLDLVRQFTQITVTECDNMPTNVCLDCEEKMVSFQLFILECYKIQDSLRKLCLDRCENLNIKIEDGIVDFGIAVIKSEVKDELTAEDLLESAINNDVPLDDYDDAYQTIDIEVSEEDDDDEYDNMTIASLKEVTTATNKELTEEEKARFTEVLHKPDLRTSDFVKLDCTICGIAFKSWSHLRIHFMKTHRGIKPFTYCICGFAVKSKSVLYKHVTDHKHESRKLKKEKCTDSDDEGYSALKVNNFIQFKCSGCDKLYSSWYSLKSHCQSQHKIPPVVECKCGITLKSKSSMYKHIQDHKTPSTLQCDICSKVMKTEAALETHRLKHVPKSARKFNCSTCDKVFNYKEALRSHEKSHIPIEERKVFNCDICHLKFTSRSAVTSHKRVVHEKVKSYVCDLCGYACGTNGELRQHRAIHSDEKPFACGKCSKSFKTYSNMKTHMDTHEETSYVCYVCNRVLNSRRTLRKHLLVHEDKCRHICPYCNKAFKRRQTLKVHMYTHTGHKPLTCKWCEERFSYASTLRSHRLRCHPDKMAAQHANKAAMQRCLPDKMAPQEHSYTTYTHVAPHVTHLSTQEDYIKNDLAAVNVTKNEVDAIQ